MPNLLIVESPTKARTIGKMLGSQFDIIASMGHIRDLPERELGVDVQHDFAPVYVETPRSKQVIKNLKAAAKKADNIYLAPDPDREGEAIAWHLQNVLQPVFKGDFHRVTFHEITKEAISRALEHTAQVDQNLVDAQQARRVLDRIVGYKVSPVLWRKLEKGRSAGRVQSAALRLVVERERERTGFVPEEYWTFSVDFLRKTGEIFSSRLFKINDSDFKISCEKDAVALQKAVMDGSTPTVAGVSCTSKKRNAPPPFTTSTLQQSANVAFNFSASATMHYAQQLYEGVDLGNGNTVGLITYMRTDSVTLSRESQLAAAAFIKANYGPEYLPGKFNVYKNKAAAQEAHEAIRPTDVNRTPESVAPYLEPAQLKLYTLIWKRFVASQMAPAVLEQNTVDVDVCGKDSNMYRFRSVASVVTFPGYTCLFNDSARQENESREAALLKTISKNELLAIEKFDPAKKFTEPPPRYTEAALIKALEENGIGRPSTYATILRTIQDREYVKKEQGKLAPTDSGTVVNDFLVERFPDLFDIAFTAKMETKLDDIEAGKLGWVDMMHEFYDQLIPWILSANNFDAPESAAAAELVNVLQGIEFDEESGSKRFNSRRFFSSVENKFRQSGSISARQYQALISLAGNVLDKIPQEKFSSLSQEAQDKINAAAKVSRAGRAKREKDAAAASQLDYNGLFAAFDDVAFAPPETRGRIVYDDKKFVASLKKQAMDGKLLSPKQMTALGKIAIKYRKMLKNIDCVEKMLDLPPETPDLSASESTAATPAGSGVEALFAALSQVTFAEPVKRGRFVYDDKKFFDSLDKQFRSGKVLSEKQVAALQKLADKYGVKTK